MSLRFFVDHCVPRVVIQGLREGGHEVFRLSEQMSPDAPDYRVIEKAQELNCVLVSLNGDFADIVSYPPSRYRGIICLQVKNRPEVLPAILQRLHHHIAFHPSMDQYQGKLIVIGIKGTRTRKKK